MIEALRNLLAAFLGWLAGFLSGAEAVQADQARKEANELRRQRDIADRPNKDINQILDEMRNGKS